MNTIKNILNTHSQWISSLALAALMLFSITAFIPKQNTSEHFPLKGPPAEDGIFFIGNSMFGTGLDLSLVQEELPREHSTFAYYNGHYTNMWYAAIRNSLIPSAITPKVVVWGFRPTYAVSPAFRQNKPTDLDNFLDPDDKIFSQILANANDPVYSLSTNQRDVKNDTSILQRISALPPFNRRQSFQDRVSNHLYNFSLKSAATVNARAETLTQETTPYKISDLIISHVTSGRIKRADALVIDNGDRFVRGTESKFENSFIPLIAENLRTAEIPQFVIIFKPVSTLKDGMPEAAQQYYQDAVSFFDENSIPYIDLVSDTSLTQEYYAEGDHYNAEGMTFVTMKIVRELKNHLADDNKN